jgi:hypothetical protein
VQDTPEKDGFFHFMDGLENWNEKELERRGVKDLASEMAAAEKLIDLKKKDSAKYKANKNAQGKGGREKEKGHSGDKDGSGKSSTHKHHQEKRKEGRDKSHVSFILSDLTGKGNKKEKRPSALSHKS